MVLGASAFPSLVIGLCDLPIWMALLDKAVPRVNLASLSDWQWTRETGHRIADFLGVPAIDKLYHGG